MGRKISELIGTKVGHLTITRLVSVENSRSNWECQCDCGQFVVKSYVALIQKRKNPLSCGCDLGYLKADKIEITYQGKTQSMAAWSKELNIGLHTLKKRYSRGAKGNPDRLLKPVTEEAKAKGKKLVEARIYNQKPCAKYEHTDDSSYPDLKPLNVRYYWEERQSVQVSLALAL